MPDTPNSFHHSTHLASEILILKLEGSLDRNSREELKTLFSEIESMHFNHLVLSLERVNLIEPINHRILVQLQILVRNRDAQGCVRVIAPPSSIKDRLTLEGILKKEEIHKDLKSALESL